MFIIYLLSYAPDPLDYTAHKRLESNRRARREREMLPIAIGLFFITATAVPFI